MIEISKNMAKRIGKKKELNIISLIIAGGEGVRLWPLSTPENPKPFIKLIGEKSFLRMAYERALMISPKEKVFISTLEKLSRKIFREIPEFPKKNLILEPMPKNTAPAIALAAMELKKFGEESVLAVLPADHYIVPLDKFKKAIFAAAKKASEGDYLLTFGIKPESPSTEYGYIETESLSGSMGIFKVKRFTEKPNLKKAKSFLKKGNYFWNSGMFVWRFDSILKAIQKHAPDIFNRLLKVERYSKRIRAKDALQKEFSKIKPISIDYAVMEKAENCYMTELKATWKDFGSLYSIDEYLKKNKLGNYTKGLMLANGCKSSTFWLEKGKICAFGVNNMLVFLVDGNLVLLDKSKRIDPNKIKNQIKKFLDYEKI